MTKALIPLVTEGQIVVVVVDVTWRVVVSVNVVVT
jgi:hypothetical protein